MSKPLSPAVQALKSQGVFKRLIKAWRYSVQGFRAAWTHEAAFRSEAVLFAAMCLGLWFMPLSLGQKALMLGMGLLTLVVELLNSAIEAVVDLVSPDMHPLAGRAKDIASAAVFLCLISTGIVWGYLLCLGFGWL